jgi:hypothetical protein
MDHASHVPSHRPPITAAWHIDDDGELVMAWTASPLDERAVYRSAADAPAA